MNKKSGEKVAREFADFCNTMSNSEEEQKFAEELCYRTHRTIQQTAFGVMVRCMKLWADEHKKGSYDLRNEATVQICKRVIDLLEDEIYLPFV